MADLSSDTPGTPDTSRAQETALEINTEPADSVDERIKPSAQSAGSVQFSHRCFATGDYPQDACYFFANPLRTTFGKVQKTRSQAARFLCSVCVGSSPNIAPVCRALA